MSAVQGRVLIIEPDEVIASVIALALRDEGYTASCAHDAGHALALLSDGGDYDLVLSTPLAAPTSSDGYTWLEQLRAHTRAAIIICVREPGARYADYATRGFAAVLEEPFDLSDMLSLIAALCPGTVATGEDDAQDVLASDRDGGKQW